jgi:hypothetical protein
MAEHKACKRVYEYPDAQFAAGMKVTTVGGGNGQSNVDQLASTNPVKWKPNYTRGKKTFVHSKSTFVSTRRKFFLLIKKWIYTHS